MTAATPNVRKLIEALDEATRAGEVEEVTRRVKSALSECVRERRLSLPTPWTRPSEECYARRLVHLSTERRYSVVAMVWSPGQGTPIHDHDGMWCVECVYEGEISVTSYEICPTSDPSRVTFDFCGTTLSTLGEAGALIPPHDYHVVENRSRIPAVTIHVYGGELTSCNVYEPIEGSGSFRQQRRELCYTAS